MRERQGQKISDKGLSGRERGAIQEFLAYIEDRVKGSEPVCANLVRKARLALTASPAAEGDATLH